MTDAAFGIRYKELAGQLEKCPEVTRYNSSTEGEAWTLAHALLDLDESFQRFSDQHLPTLMNREAPTTQIYGTLLAITDEFRHILYHMRDPKFFRHLFELEEPRNP